MAKLVGMNGVESLVSLLLQQASHAAAANRAAQHRAPGQLRADGVSADSSEGVVAQVRLAQGEHPQLWYAVTRSRRTRYYARLGSWGTLWRAISRASGTAPGCGHGVTAAAQVDRYERGDAPCCTCIVCAA